MRCAQYKHAMKKLNTFCHLYQLAAEVANSPIGSQLLELAADWLFNEDEGKLTQYIYCISGMNSMKYTGTV